MALLKRANENSLLAQLQRLS